MKFSMTDEDGYGYSYCAHISDNGYNYAYSGVTKSDAIKGLLLKIEYNIDQHEVELQQILKQVPNYNKEEDSFDIYKQLNRVYKMKDRVMKEERKCQ